MPIISFYLDSTLAIIRVIVFIACLCYFKVLNVCTKIKLVYYENWVKTQHQNKWRNYVTFKQKYCDINFLNEFYVDVLSRISSTAASVIDTEEN